MRLMLRAGSLFLALVSLSLLGGLAARGASPMCGDADGSGKVTVTDGVQTLRSAAGLSTSCAVASCDVDRNGSISVTDGVNVLRAAAGLSVNLACAPQGRFIDNGDGTVIDTETELQWEKKTTAVGSGENPADPHDVDNAYTWSHDRGAKTASAFGDTSDGTVFTDFLPALNTPPCFAGHCDWRLPTVDQEGDPAELETILDSSAPGCGVSGPCIDAIFGPTIAVDAPVFLGPTYPQYWSATASVMGGTWVTDFFRSLTYNDNDDDLKYARAVRHRDQ